MLCSLALLSQNYEQNFRDANWEYSIENYIWRFIVNHYPEAALLTLHSNPGRDEY